MADKTKINILTVRDLSAKTVQERAEETVLNLRIRQLSALRLYHKEEITKIDEELRHLLKDDIMNMVY